MANAAVKFISSPGKSVTLIKQLWLKLLAPRCWVFQFCIDNTVIISGGLGIKVVWGLMLTYLKALYYSSI